MSTPSQIAVNAIVAHLREALGASVIAVNSTRFATLTAPNKEPYVLPSGTSWVARIGLGETPGFDDVWLIPPGTYTATQLAAQFDVQNQLDAAFLGTASAVDGRLSFRGTQPVSTFFLLSDPGILGVPPAVTINALLGFPAGSILANISHIVAPTVDGICDGYPLTAPDMGQGFWVIVADREATPDGDTTLRRDIWDVSTELHIAMPTMPHDRHRSREAISACVDAVTRCFLTIDGRQLGRATSGDILKVEVVSERIAGQPIQLDEVRNVLFDTAIVGLRVRVYQRPVSG